MHDSDVTFPFFGETLDYIFSIFDEIFEDDVEDEVDGQRTLAYFIESTRPFRSKYYIEKKDEVK